MLWRGDGVAGGSVHHHDAPLGGRLHVDVVHPNASAADDLKPTGGGDDLPRYLRFAADDEGVIATDRLPKLVSRKAGANVNLSARALKHLYPIFGDGITD